MRDSAPVLMRPSRKESEPGGAGGLAPPHPLGAPRARSLEPLGAAPGDAPRPTAVAALALRVDGLRHRYGADGPDVLDDLDLSVAEGEIVGLLGPNGSGKSTALRIVSGLLAPTAGRVAVAGLPVGPRAAAARARVGVVFQSPSLDLRLSARENLELAATLHGVDRAAVGPALGAAQLAGRADDLVATYSGGMRRRLDIARALLHDPALLILDEPTAGLDEASFRATWDQIEARRAAGGVSALVTTHRPEEADRCDRVVVLSGGRAVASDRPSALKARLASDVIVVEGDDPGALAAAIEQRFRQQISPLTVLRDGDRVTITCERGHELVPRLVEAFDGGRLRSVGLRQPSLADAFLAITGSSLHADADAEAAL